MNFYAVFVGCPNSDAQMSASYAGTDLDECCVALAPQVAQILSDHADIPIARFEGKSMGDLLGFAEVLGFWAKEMTEFELCYA